MSASLRPELHAKGAPNSRKVLNKTAQLKKKKKLPLITYTRRASFVLYSTTIYTFKTQTAHNTHLTVECYDVRS